MDIPSVSLATEDILETYVREVLCERDRLDAKQTTFHRTAIVRNGRHNGWLFHVKGPRMLRNSAIWPMSENRILFYDSTGKRFQEVKLSEKPMERALKIAA